MPADPSPLSIPATVGAPLSGSSTGVATALPPLRVAILGADRAACLALARTLEESRPPPHGTDPAGSRAIVVDAEAPLQRWAHARAGDEAAATAAESGLLVAMAQHKPAFHLTLLLGCEDGPAAAAVDGLLRAALMQAGVAFQVLHGTAQAREAQGRKALQALTPRRSPPSPAGGAGAATCAVAAVRLRAWGCEKCSDPECEHQLFQRLLASR